MAVSRLLRHFFLDIGLFLLVGIFLAVNAGWTPSRIISQLSNVCTDSDGFANIRVWGRAQGENGTLDDYCKDSKTNMEAYCTFTGPAYTQIPCPGNCNRGVCYVSSFSSRSYSWSSVSFSEISSSESSSESSSSRSFSSLPPMSFCTDSDAGLNYNTVGNVTEEVNGNRYVTWDQCRDAQTVAEAYCESSSAATQLYVCPTGCDAGKCRNTSSTNSIPVFSLASSTYSSLQYSSFPLSSSSATPSSFASVPVSSRPPIKPGCPPEAPAWFYDRYFENYSSFSSSVASSSQASSTPTLSSSSSCTDSDGGIDYSRRGNVTSNGEVTWDSCLDGQTIVERFCGEAGPLVIIARCDEQCVNGACVPYGYVPPVSSSSSSSSSSVSINPPTGCTVSGGATKAATYNGHCYLYYPRLSDFWEAVSTCESIGAHLVTITSAGEKNAVTIMGAQGWIGLTAVRSGLPEWITGEPRTIGVSLSNDGVENGCFEDCWIFAGGWGQDSMCNGYQYDDGKQGSICEYDSIPSATTLSVTGGNPCGDGFVGTHEACDDGNNKARDGCSAMCNVESGWYCDGSPSVCTRGQRPLPKDPGEETAEYTKFSPLSVMPFCTDSDAGLNYDTAGIVTEEKNGNRFITWDTCRGDQTLAEATCQNSSTSIRFYNCPTGCDAGKCRHTSP